MIYKVRESKTSQQVFENGEWKDCSQEIFLSYYYQWVSSLDLKSKHQYQEDGYTVFETQIAMGSNKPYPKWMED